jgi:four helix bundle protein
MIGTMSNGRASIESHRDLVVWRKSSQIRRSGASVPANIAEGYGRESAGAYAQQLRVRTGLTEGV